MVILLSLLGVVLDPEAEVETEHRPGKGGFFPQAD